MKSFKNHISYKNKNKQIQDDNDVKGDNDHDEDDDSESITELPAPTQIRRLGPGLAFHCLHQRKRPSKNQEKPDDQGVDVDFRGDQ